ncbi:paromamine 6'-oxidase/6'''-hydroxyneomycin C oxidase/2'-deamino-2'-hydroxyparomamine 6'-oxidase [Actinoalloteichus hoggarensis]|uniref:6'''-hydroxyparomomycin C oxidase n=1 Tax=Actinoalloteichus hoggarensis TaxID=1470176 RepID=A0A221VZ05_9PSEU|nr:GMC family oxidoreductase [Actinoalloteichus hoggarensis]ASO18730.1 6'''-hydroxyparomomycin C oxidase [Actinoalloteichus hoggarensis]MBB5919963.1 paromamine 6'-oxidase/6'''-hydroxyneomycin C oxidase/2'-deamino-2'-hydroxyparomamine 6'-oxidase [Actinoalloteichus hoggarensis]
MIGPTDPSYGPVPTAADLADAYDVCVIGSGASGATTAWLMARAGLRVVVVEQGRHVTDAVSYDDLLAESEAAWVRQENGTWGKVGYPWTTCNVGGGTVFYGGALFRNRPIDFDAESALGRADLPLRWPWGPEELDPYYTAIETLVGVAGAANLDPTLPRRDTSYPLPPIARSAEGELLAQGARALGWHPFPTPLAVNSRGRHGRPACVGDAPCICRRCPIGAKGDAVTRFLDPAIRAGATLFAGLKAVRLHSEGRAATALECVRMDTGSRHLIRAARFVVCANAVQTAALLLRSTGDRHPTGLGNTHDLVGRGLCFKLSEYLVGYRHTGEVDRNDSEVMGLGPFSTCAVTDLYQRPAAPGGLGGILYEARPERRFRLRRSEQLVRIEALVPDEPQPGNRVRLGTGVDAHGVTDVVMDYQAHPRDLARLEYMLRRGEEVLAAAGCEVTVREASGWAMGSSHLHGTCRMGTDPASSVTDPDGRLHDTDNVYVGDGAVLPFPGGVNPTLTIQAVALRTARRILVEDLGIDVPVQEIAGHLGTPRADADGARLDIGPLPR